MKKHKDVEEVDRKEPGKSIPTKRIWKKCKLSMRDIHRFSGFRALRLQVSTGTAKSQEASFGTDIALSASQIIVRGYRRNDPLDLLGT